MTFVRRHLRRGVTVWLMCHALAFTALVPRDCCAAHAHAAPEQAGSEAGAEPAPCHDLPAAPAPGTHCEMAAADGAACPMHRSPQPSASTPSASDCAMSGSCQAPAAALAAVMLQAAVLVPALEVTPLADPQTARASLDVSARSLAIPPDSPPPRA